MKCPSCGIWNRAHFTKCFRCGAPLTKNPDEEGRKAKENTAASAEEDEVKTVAVPEAEPVTYDSPASNLSDSDRDFSAPTSSGAQEADVLTGDQIFSLYDQGNWSDEDEEDSDEVYSASASSKSAPSAPSEDPDEEDDEAPTVYRPPEKKPFSPPLPAMKGEETQSAADSAPNLSAASEAPGQETRLFTPVDPGLADGSTRKFSPIGSGHPDAPDASPADTEPEPAPADPSISHEIIQAIFTNPPIPAAPGQSILDDPRPRKLMSRKRLPPEPEAEDEPETVMKPKVEKAEPRVDRVEEFKPTARMAAQKADEKGDEFTAFATAKRTLVAEVEPSDPFEEAIGLNKTKEEDHGEDSEKGAETPEASAPAEKAEPEQPSWVREAFLNLGQENQTPRSPSRGRGGRSFQSFKVDSEPETVQAPRPVPASEGKPSERSEGERRRPSESETPVRPAYTPARTGLEAIERFESGRSSSVLNRRYASNSASPSQEEERLAREEGRLSLEEDRLAREEGRLSREEKRLAREESRLSHEEEFYDQEEEPAPARSEASRPRRIQSPRDNRMQEDEEPVRERSDERRPKSASRTLRIGKYTVENPLRAALVLLLALLLLGLLIFGISAGISAISKSKPAESASTEESPAETETEAETDPNAPVVTTGEVNGRPGHIITFKGNDNDIIYISDSNLTESYNIAIVDGVGTLQVEDSVLIGDRYADDDVEITLNPVLHESGSGKETQMDPITFTVTPPDAYLEIVSPENGTDETTLSIYQVKIRVEIGSTVTIDGNDVSDMITEESDNMGSIVTNVNVEAKGENEIPITVMKKGCKSVTQNIVLTRPAMTVPIELDASTPSTVQSDTVTITGTVEAGVTVSVTSPISGEVTNNSDGSFSFVAKLSFGENEIVMVATKGEESSTLTHTVTYEPTYSEYVNKAYKMDYNSLTTYAGKYQPFLCKGQVVEVFQTEPYTCTFNVGTDEDPKYIYLQMVEGKPLEEGKTYKVYADVDASGTKDGYPYLIGRFYLEMAE